ncbi:hypothetical protein F5883DRAFT_1516 [Diaporthe sp. PMI_573]|nr:hypothetical protein F5883DRAFT_1516 [Diaporthaceae sp. PMI_573]
MHIITLLTYIKAANLSLASPVLCHPFIFSCTVPKSGVGFPRSRSAFHARTRSSLTPCASSSLFPAPELTFALGRCHRPRTPQQSQEGRKDQPKPPNSRRATILLQHFER